MWLNDHWVPNVHANVYRLPFAIDNGCGLGVVTQVYLQNAEKAAESGKTSSDQLKETIKEKYFHGIDVGENLETAFGIWDAVRYRIANGKLFTDFTCVGYGCQQCCWKGIRKHQVVL